MGTSLMNDSAYAYDISTHLIEMAETLFFKFKDEQSGVEREVALDEDEIDEITEIEDK